MRDFSEELDVCVSDYYKWLIGQGGTDPGTLLRKPLPEPVRRELIDRMNDVNVGVAFAEFVREAVLPCEVTEATSTGPLSSPPPM